jgi:hypothetical protein
MTVASIDLCKTLFSDSGWFGTSLNYFRFHDGKETIEPRPMSGYISAQGIPAYDLGYLLRKLPPSTAIRKRPTNGATKEYSAFTAVRRGVVALDSTPEDAAARLAIQLFKQAVLRKAAGET